MNRNFPACWLVMMAAMFSGDVIRADDGGEYLKHVKPLLAARCYACHGALKQAGGLRLDTAQALRKGGDSGSAFSFDDPASSVLLQRVASNDIDQRMPPEGEGSALKAEEISLLKNWISTGAIAPKDEKPEPDPREHWAFRVPARPARPVVKQATWIKNPIDTFIAAEHERHQLTPQPTAERGLLLRRLYFDLVGLPPTGAELSEFVHDETPDAYERVVDRLLASPQHAERWARHWMDIWRYSDWYGLETDVRNSQKNIWHWRDWIVESLNADVGYDEMWRQMLSADEQHPDDLSKLRATGYLARSYYKFNRNTWLEQVVEHTSKGVLGITLNCSRCHDHKYDPFAQKDYYRFRAFFEPYQVRMDLLPGAANYDQNGLPRAFDCNLDAPTYRFTRGEESLPVKDDPIAPGLPALMTASDIEIQPVVLPITAHQPGLRPWVLNNLLARAEADVLKAKTALDAAKKTLPSSAEPFDNLVDAKKPALEKTLPAEVPDQKAKRPTDQAKLSLTVAEKKLAAAEAEIPSLQARAAADRAQFLGSADEAKFAAQAAAQAERIATLASAEAEVAAAELEVLRTAAAKRAVPEKVLTTARAKLAKAKTAIAKNEGDYTPLRGALKSFQSSTETEDERLRPFPKTSTGRRTALARQLTDRQNPLMARVAANHIWLRHMGKALVPTVFDFGRNGSPPTHPELLDWLAVEFRDGPESNCAEAEHITATWSMKHLHRTIVTSSTFRMSASAAGAEVNLQRDADNQYYWRKPAIRLEAQAVRDALLRLSGELNLSMGGPSLDSTKQEFSPRRSLYFTHSPRDYHRFLEMFDDAKVTECYRREQNIVPQQALALANSKQALQASPGITAQLLEPWKKNGTTPTDDEFIQVAFLTVLGEEPTNDELHACRDALVTWRAIPLPPQVGDRSRQNLVHALLNHNNFITVK